ncbi:MAG: quinone oxidoreductase [Candidatus Promineifilaceae bacterium]|nr:quinone oxidoreductase [Candidatus Promineifilaceae bacterium]
MKAIRVHDYGSADNLVYESVEQPDPGDGQVCIRIEAAGLNFIDIYQRSGSYPGDVPFILGMEGAGTIAALGPDVTDFSIGDRVAYAMVRGAYAEYAVVPAWRVVRVPDAVNLEQAAALMLQGTTAHYLSESAYPLGAADTALVHAAAGGVGLLLVQLAKRRGARVIGTCSTVEKESLARTAGADEIVRYTEVDFEEAVLELTNGQGVSVVYDSVGQDTFAKSLNVLQPRGYMVLYGQSSGPVDPVDPQTLNQKGSLFLTRPSLSHYLAAREEIVSRANDLFDWVADGELQVRIDRIFPLAEAADAHRYMEQRHTKGKVLLIP